MKICAVIFMALVLSVVTTQSSAAVVWSDNFDDGNYDGWTLESGGYTCSEGYLECTEDTVYAGFSEIYRSSSVSVGTWSFDFYYAVSSHLRVYYWTDEAGISHGSNFFIQMDGARIMLRRYTEGGTSALNLDQWAPEGSYVGKWNHVDVTMDESFVTNVFVNGTHRIHYTSVSPEAECAFFIVAMNNIGDAIDNIVVSDTIDLQPNASYITTTTTETTQTDTDTTTPPPDGATTFPIEILALGGGAVVLLIVVVILLKRRG